MFPWATFVEGPRTGLGANRNSALRNCSSSHVMYLDDDARLSPGFVGRMLSELVRCADLRTTVLTGAELRDGYRIVPHDVSFLGFQSVSYQSNSANLRSIVINATVFPRNALATVGFNDCIRYGYEELDVAFRLVERGARILFVPDATVFHYPSPVNRAEYARDLAASRLYVHFSRLRRRRGLLVGVLWLSIGIAHQFAHEVRSQGIRALPSLVQTGARFVRILSCGSHVS